MKNLSCPISNDLVNSKLTRIYAIITFVSIAVYLFTPFKAIIYLTATDFLIRVLFTVKYSPICNLIKYILKVSQTSTHMVNAGPKKFAAKIGFIFSMMMLLGHILGYSTFSYFVGAMFFVAVGLEAIFGYCLACAIYSKLPSNLFK